MVSVEWIKIKSNEKYFIQIYTTEMYKNGEKKYIIMIKFKVQTKDIDLLTI